MKNNFSFLLLMAMLFCFTSCQTKQKEATLSAKEDVLKTLTLTNKYFMDKWPDTGKTIITNKERPSNIWTRAVYYEGLMDLYKLTNDKSYLDYAISWGESHHWRLAGHGVKGSHADYHVCGQTYIELFKIDKQDNVRIKDIEASIDLMMATDKVDDWDWIDALQMAMPIFEQLAVLTGDDTYMERAHAMYLDTQNPKGYGMKMTIYGGAMQTSCLLTKNQTAKIAIGREATVGLWQPTAECLILHLIILMQKSIKQCFLKCLTR